MALVRSSGIGIAGLDEVVADVRVREDVRDKFGPLLGLFEQLLKCKLDFIWFFPDVTRSNNFEAIESLGKISCLHPYELSMVPKILTQYFGSSFGDFLGMFMSLLIQKSYNAGYNDFHFDLINRETTNQPAEYVPMMGNLYDLHGREGNPIRIYLKGSCGDHVGSFSSNIHLEGEWAGDDAGSHSTHSVFQFKTVGKSYGIYTKNSQFKSHLVGAGMGTHSHDSDFRTHTFTGAIGDYSRNCIFEADLAKYSSYPESLFVWAKDVKFRTHNYSLYNRVNDIRLDGSSRDRISEAILLTD